MSMQDPISDMLTRIRNGQSAHKKNVVMPSSNLKVAIATVLKAEGYITDFEVLATNPSKLELQVVLKYIAEVGVIDRIKRVSRPGLRVYRSASELPKILGGLGISIVSTSQGVITDKTARQLGVGGELLCEVA